MPLNLTDFDQILKRALSEHMEIFQNVVKILAQMLLKTPASVRTIHNHHQLQGPNRDDVRNFTMPVICFP